MALESLDEWFEPNFVVFSLTSFRFRLMEEGIVRLHRPEVISPVEEHLSLRLGSEVCRKLCSTTVAFTMRSAMSGSH